MILSDLITGRSNPWAEIFDAMRVKPLAGGASFISENLSAGAHLVEGYVWKRPRSVGELAPGEAAVLKLDGKRLAVFKDERGTSMPSRPCARISAASSAGTRPIAPGTAPATARVLQSMAA